MNYNDLNNLSIDIKTQQEKRFNMKDELIRLEKKKSDVLKEISDFKSQIENEFFFGEKSQAFKTDTARKTAAKSEIEADHDYIKLNEKLNDVHKTINGIELDLRKNQIDIDFLSRNFQIMLVFADTRGQAIPQFPVAFQPA
jgi:hypothetical protein